MNPGPSTVVTSNTGTATSCLHFASISAPIGATISFADTSSNANIWVGTGSTNGILGGYAYYNNADFVAVSSTGGIISAYTGYTNGNLGTLPGNSVTVNAKPTLTQSAVSTALTIYSLNLAARPA